MKLHKYYVSKHNSKYARYMRVLPNRFIMIHKQTWLSKSLSISMKEVSAVVAAMCSGSKLAVGSIVSVLVTVKE